MPQGLPGQSGTSAQIQACFERLELQFHLIEPLAAPFGGSTKSIVLQAGDHRLQMRDHSLGAGCAGVRLPVGQSLRRESSAMCVDIRGKQLVHANDTTTNASIGTENECEMLSIFNGFNPPLPDATVRRGFLERAWPARFRSGPGFGFFNTLVHRSQQCAIFRWLGSGVHSNPMYTQGR